MKRYILFLSVVTALLTSCRKEEISDLQSGYFIKFFGDYLYDAGMDIIEISGNNLLITGCMESPATGKDIILMGVDSRGNQTNGSPKYFDYDGDETGYALFPVDDGYLIAGCKESADGDMDALVFKTDKNGNKTGDEYVFSSGGDEYAMDIEQRAGGGYFVVGYSEGLTNGEQSFFVLGLDENLSNVKITASPSIGETFLRVFNTGTGEYTALGNRYSTDGSGQSQFFGVKVNETGNIFDIKFYGSLSDKEVMTDAVSTSNYDIYVLGTSYNSGSAGSRVVLKKITGFQEVWTRYIGETNCQGKALYVKDDGSFIIGADKMEGSDKNMLIYFVDADGNVQGSREYGEEGNQSVEDILLSGESLIILGRNELEGNSMISLIKTDESGNLWE